MGHVIVNKNVEDECAVLLQIAPPTPAVALFPLECAVANGCYARQVIHNRRAARGRVIPESTYSEQSAFQDNYCPIALWAPDTIDNFNRVK